MPEARADIVAQVIANVGFKGEIVGAVRLSTRASPRWPPRPHLLWLERVQGREGLPDLGDLARSILAIVQDADRLDAIGAIGIGRTFTYGGAKLRPMHDPAIPPRVLRSKEDYVGGGSGARAPHENPTLNHFFEKLLLLKDKMKTRAGRAHAERRHAFMEAFVAQFLAEWDGRDSPPS
jgi:hypothetical protein